MKILLDENLPKKLKPEFSVDDEVFTAQRKNWNGKKNGELLGLMTLEGFDTFITIDKTDTLLPYLENLKTLLQKSTETQIIIVEAD
jgi:hypothetical protein